MTAPSGPSKSATPTEKFLARLCERTFLSLWSFPSPFREQKAAEKGDGKELTDLLVVFGNDIVIFSDKNVALKREGDLAVNWSRWYRAAVIEGAKQLFGAERWLKAFPDKVFLDRGCTVPLPVALPDPQTARFHRVVVVHGAAQACRDAFGGTGSLMVSSSEAEAESRPFTIAPPFPDKGFVHVIDEAVLSELLGHLDTASDLVSYLAAKERLFTSNRTVFTAGEEELLGFYLSQTGPTGEHDFVLPEESNHLWISDGYWEQYLNSPERAAKEKADEVSYAWDRLIEKFTFHMRGGTSVFSTLASVPEMEPVPRWMARENRTRRRMLARKLVSLVTHPRPKGDASLLLPSRQGDPYWVFVVLPEKPMGVSHEVYRERRRNLLQAYCYVVKHLYPEATDICGIATNADADEGMSEDALFLDTRVWNEGLAENARWYHEHLGLFKRVNISQGTENEYPVEIASAEPLRPSKRVKVGRNDPCPCGSGKKYKKCCLK